MYVPVVGYETEGSLLLDVAIRSEDADAALNALREGANPNERGVDGLTPLHLAAARQDAALIGALIDHGADVLSMEPRMGSTPLHLSAQSGTAEITAVLLDRGAFIDQQSPVLGNTALMDAVLYRSDEVARVLLERGARTRIRNHWNQTALELAREEQRHDVARWIEERDRADAEALAASTLVTAVVAGDAENVRIGVTEGAAVNGHSPVTGRVDDDYTALGIAARDGHVDLVEVLLDAGADPSLANGLMGGTALHEAAYFGHTDVINALIDSSPQTGRTAPVLDAQGAYNGFTALHDAVWRGHEAAARALVRAGARTDLRSHTGLTPYDLALRYGYGPLAAFLADATSR